nr:maleylacetate reductase 1 [Quercus suber]
MQTYVACDSITDSWRAIVFVCHPHVPCLDARAISSVTINNVFDHPSLSIPPPPSAMVFHRPIPPPSVRSIFADSNGIVGQVSRYSRQPAKYLSTTKSFQQTNLRLPNHYIIPDKQHVSNLLRRHSLCRSVTAPFPGQHQKRYKSKSTESSQNPLSGLWKPTHLVRLHYGPEAVKQHLLDCLPSDSSKAFIITGNSLATKTSLIKQVEQLLGDKHAGTFSKIGQHAPVKELDEATKLVHRDEKVDTIISIGGGSPIDSAKAISYRLNEKQPGRFLYHISIPTTLSAAECTLHAGYTKEDGMKTSVSHPELALHVVIYDAKFALETPAWLWMSTALRALDHALESMYHPTTTEMPCRWMCLQAAGELFTYLPRYHADPRDEEVITRLQLAAFASLGFLALNVQGGLGLSHSLGYALGSPYQIPHGITSCLTLGHVVKLKAQGSAADARQLARMAPFVGVATTGDDRRDATAVGDAILDLVQRLGLKTTLTEKQVGKDQAHTITKLATRQESGPQYDAVRRLVEGLW